MKEGCEVEYYDPYVPSIEIQLQNQGMHEGKQTVRLDSISELSAKKVGSADLVAVLTGHSCVDYEAVVRAAKAVLDTRNAICDVGVTTDKVGRL